MKHVKLKRVFSSILVSYIVVLLLPALLVGILMGYTRRETEADCIDGICGTLSREVSRFENEVESMEEDARSLYSNTRLRYIAQQEGMKDADKNIIEVMRLNRELNGMFLKSDFYEQYALVLSNGYTFRNSGVTLGKDHFFNYYRFYEELSCQEWEEASFQRTAPFFFPMQKITINRWTGEYLSFCYPAVVQGSQNIAGSLQFLIQREKLEQMFSSLTEAGDEAGLYIFDETGDCIVSVNGAVLPQDLYGALDQQKEQGDMECSFQGKQWIVVWQKGLADGLTFAFTAPSSEVLESVYSFQALSVFLVILLLIVELYLGVSFARKYAMPIRNVLSNIERFMIEEGAGKGEPAAEKERLNEYEYLEDRVEKLIVTSRNHWDTLQKSKLHERLNYLSLLFHGEFQSHDLAVAEAENAGIFFKGRQFSVFVAAGGSGLSEALESLEGPLSEAVAAVRGQTEDEMYLLMQFGGGLPEPDYKEFIESFYHALSEMIEGRLQMGCGSCYQDLTDIDDSYLQAVYCLRYAGREGLGYAEYGSVTEERNDPWYPRELEEKLRNTVKNGSEEAITEIMAKMREENLQKRSLEMRMEAVFKNMLIATLISIGRDMILEKRLDEYLRDLYKEKSLPDMLSRLEEIFKEICRESQMTKKSQEDMYAERLNQYVTENYTDNMLSICMAAEAFSLSEGYFSRFYKRIMGKSFSDCLEELRLNKAKEFMRDTEDTVEEIAGKVGYGNGATFRRAFKRVYGISPNQWKQSCREQNRTKEDTRK